MNRRAFLQVQMPCQLIFRWYYNVIMNIFFCILGGLLFLIALIAHLYVKVSLRPKPGSDFDDYYHEFEDQHPGFARYTKWSKITFTAAVIGALLLFLAVVV